MHSPLIRDLLSAHKDDLGADFEKYHNHVCRVYSYAVMLRQANEEEQNQLAIAAAFHDIGIWTANTFDYLAPSIRLAETYLMQNNKSNWKATVREIIVNHHKLRPYKGNPLAESFRKADLIDLSHGLISFGISTEQLKTIEKQYPSLGFRTFIAKEILKNCMLHPFNPLPIVKW